VRICPVPREVLSGIDLDGYVESAGYDVPWSRFGEAPWSLERPDVGALMEKIEKAGILLRDFTGVKPYWGVLTGLNEVFLIDESKKNELIYHDPKSSEIIKPYLRGQDIKRWSPQWQELWMIFTRRGIDIDSYPGIKSYLTQYREYLEPRPKHIEKGKWKGRKPGSFKWYELQDAIDYYELFEKPKIVYQEIQFHSAYCFDDSNYFSNNKGFILPSDSLYVLGILNSPLMWWYNWRYLPHMKDEALNPAGYLVEQFPIAPPTDEIREQTEPKVQRLIDLTKTNQQFYRDVLDWMQSRFEIDKLGQKLERFANLSEDEFLTELRKRIPKKGKTTDPLGVAGQKEVKQLYNDYALPMQTRNREILQLEHQVSDLVNQAYGLTPEDLDLMWRTAPPRMPIQRTTQPISDAIA